MRVGPRVIFFVTALSMLVFSMQFSMVSVALADIRIDLDAPLRWIGWVLTLFMIGQVVSMPVAGRLAERFGKRRVFMVGLGCFAAGSLGCALAPNIYALIGARGLQGLAGGAMMPSAMGIIGEAFKERRARWIGLMGSIVPLGGVVGPSIGGLIVDYLGWRWTFALNVPLAAVAVLAIALLVPADRDLRYRRLDVRGITLLGVGAAALVFALTELGQRGIDPNPLLVGGALLLSVAAIALLVHREMTVDEPPIDVDLLRRREFLFANSLSFVFGAGLFGFFNVIPLYTQEAYGMSATEAGALVTPRAIAMVVTSTVAATLLTRTGYRKPILGGMLAMSGTLALLSLGLESPTLLGVELSSFVWLTTIVAFAGVAFGFTNPSLNNAALDLAPERIPSVAGLRGMFMSLGGTIGVTVILLVASRASTIEAGLQASFVGLAVMFVAAAGLVFGVPEMVREGEARRAPAPPAVSPAAAEEPAAVGAGSAPAAAGRRSAEGRRDSPR